MQCLAVVTVFCEVVDVPLRECVAFLVMDEVEGWRDGGGDREFAFVEKLPYRALQRRYIG